MNAIKTIDNYEVNAKYIGTLEKSEIGDYEKITIPQGTESSFIIFNTDVTKNCNYIAFFMIDKKFYEILVNCDDIFESDDIELIQVDLDNNYKKVNKPDNYFKQIKDYDTQNKFKKISKKKINENNIVKKNNMINTSRKINKYKKWDWADNLRKYSNTVNKTRKAWR